MANINFRSQKRPEGGSRNIVSDNHTKNIKSQQNLNTLVKEKGACPIYKDIC